jgi:hypothetical protein
MLIVHTNRPLAYSIMQSHTFFLRSLTLNSLTRLKNTGYNTTNDFNLCACLCSVHSNASSIQTSDRLTIRLHFM